MAKLTRAKVAYDLKISPHRHEVSYGETTILFVFSSELYKTKFNDKQEENRLYICDSLSNRFGVSVHLPILADIKLYTMIEKRGFLLYVNGVEVECREKVILDGEKVILQNLGE